MGVMCLADEDFDDLNFIETGICPQCGNFVSVECLGGSGSKYFCSRCGWSEIVPPMPDDW
jgi:hypothetical protein